MSQKRGRSTNFSREETDILIRLVSGNKSIIENKKSDAVTWQEKEMCWKNIERSFNYSSGVHYRNAKTLKIKYDALKRETRKKSALIRVEMYKTGGGPNVSPVLSTNQEKIKSMILLSVEGTESTFDSDIVKSVEATMKKKPSEQEYSNNGTQENNNLNDDNLDDAVKEILKEAEEILANGKTEAVMHEKSSLGIDSSCNVLNQIVENAEHLSTDTDNIQKENKWAQWKPKVLRSKKHPSLSNPKPKKPFERLAESKLEIAAIQKLILQEELEDERNQRLFEEEERNHKREMWILEKEYLKKKYATI